MDGWMDGCMDGWINIMDVRINTKKIYIDGYMLKKDVCMSQIDAWLDGWMHDINRRMDTSYRLMVEF